MTTGAPREYNEFMALKNAKCAVIDENNADKIFVDSRKQILKKLPALNIAKITQIEDLYLNVAELMQAASYLVAIKKAQQKEISVESALESVGTDDVSSIVLKRFINQPGKEHFSKFLAIDEKYKPSKQAWAGLHARMTLIAPIALEKSLKDTLHNYQAHLEKKLRKMGITLPLKEESEEATPMIAKLITRYDTVSQLNSTIQNKPSLDKSDFDAARQAVKICLKNKPTWTERPFLQKLIDCLSLGLKPLFRMFFSKEEKLQRTLVQNLFRPK